MKIFVISDTHFKHSNIAEYCGRPANHEKLLLSSMSQVRESDCLIHLGDISFGKEAEVYSDIIKPLKCRKILVLGNHDSKSWSWYMEHGWDFVCHAFRLIYCGKIIMFSHIPQPWDGIWEINIHGHLHNLGHRANEFQELKQWHRLYAPELMNYRPIELSEFIQKGFKKTVEENTEP